MRRRMRCACIAPISLTRAFACCLQVTEIKVVLKEMMEEEYIDEDDK